MRNPAMFIRMIHHNCSDNEILNSAVVTEGMSQDELRMAVESVKVFKDLGTGGSSGILRVTEQWIAGGTSDEG